MPPAVVIPDKKPKPQQNLKPVSFFESFLPSEELMKATNRKGLIWGLATGSALLGIRGIRDIVFAVFAHFIGWWNGNRGPSVIYNFLSGAHIHRGKWKWVVVPLIADVMDMEMGEKTNTAHVLSFLLGYVFSFIKMI